MTPIRLALIFTMMFHPFLYAVPLLWPGIDWPPAYVALAGLPLSACLAFALYPSFIDPIVGMHEAPAHTKTLDGFEVDVGIPVQLSPCMFASGLGGFASGVGIACWVLFGYHWPWQAMVEEVDALGGDFSVIDASVLSLLVTAMVQVFPGVVVIFGAAMVTNRLTKQTVRLVHRTLNTKGGSLVLTGEQVLSFSWSGASLTVTDGGRQVVIFGTSQTLRWLAEQLRTVDGEGDEAMVPASLRQMQTP